MTAEKEQCAICKNDTDSSALKQCKNCGKKYCQACQSPSTKAEYCRECVSVGGVVKTAEKA